MDNIITYPFLDNIFYTSFHPFLDNIITYPFLDSIFKNPNSIFSRTIYLYIISFFPIFIHFVQFNCISFHSFLHLYISFPGQFIYPGQLIYESFHPVLDKIFIYPFHDNSIIYPTMLSWTIHLHILPLFPEIYS